MAEINKTDLLNAFETCIVRRHNLKTALVKAQVKELKTLTSDEKTSEIQKELDTVEKHYQEFRKSLSA